MTREEALLKGREEGYNKALNDLWCKVIKKRDDYMLDLEDIDECIDELKAQGSKNWEHIESNVK